MPLCSPRSPPLFSRPAKLSRQTPDTKRQAGVGSTEGFQATETDFGPLQWPVPLSFAHRSLSAVFQRLVRLFFLDGDSEKNFCAVRRLRVECLE